MNCQDFDIAIGDAVDGTITEPAARRLQGHLATCARCAALDADLRAIRSAARALPAQPPPAHVWKAIAAAMESERAGQAATAGRGLFAGFASWQRAWQPLAAAAMAIIVTATLAAVGTLLEPLRQTQDVRLTDSVEGAGTDGAAAAGTVAADTLAVDTVRHAEGEYIEAINGLEAITSTAGDTLDQETADVLKTNLTVIDRAIGDSRAALKEEPENRLAIASLFEALRGKLALLQDMVALINEMRQGNAEGAARIASGLNQ